MWATCLINAVKESADITLAHAVREWAYEERKDVGSLNWVCDVVYAEKVTARATLIKRCNDTIIPANVICQMSAYDFKPRRVNSEHQYDYWQPRERRATTLCWKDILYCLEYGNKVKRRWTIESIKHIPGWHFVDIGVDSMLINEHRKQYNLWYNK
jgi:hypothetical protein